MNNAARELHIALHQMLSALGLATQGFDVFPRVEVMNVTVLEGAEKCGDSFNVSVLLDIVTKSDSPLQSYDIVTDVRNHINDTVSLVSNFDVNQIVSDGCVEIHEDSDNGGIFRQEQRFIFNLTLNLHKNGNGN